MSAYININGRLVRDPETRTTAKGHSMVKLTIPTETGWGDNKVTTWWSVTFFGKTGERAAQHLCKGQRVTITGKAGVRTYEKRDGSQGFSAEVDGYDWSFAGPKPQADDAAPAPKPSSNDGYSGPMHGDIPF